ncbi:MAG: NAD(+)--dinitrogen-reductase ADP-D-ribosyltransferase [Nitrospirae bacterium]|nr:NAD(+)--dinitrogen-reductase ADP-D-ribosyltransferase [Nitrospirota bacterium]
MDHKHLHYSNLIGIPTPFFASPAFNLSPVAVHINGVREMNGPLFQTLDRMDRAEAPPLFMEHMRVMFELDAEPEAGEKRRFRAHYLRLLRGWFFDANRPEGAVMKGWAESRFGLIPLFHREPLPDINGPAYWAYVAEKMSPRFHNNAIFSQLDLLYEYTQYFLHRFGPKTGRLTLYRGANLLSGEHQVLEKREKTVWVVRNNSLVSYTSEKERADEFGDVILRVEVPFEKVLCFSDLLPGKLAASEAEYILLGGDYLSDILDF